MKYCECRHCGERFEVVDAYAMRINGDEIPAWYTNCPHCWHLNAIDIDDYIIPEGTPVVTQSGRNGRINAALKTTFEDGKPSLTSILYLVKFEDGNLEALAQDRFHITSDWRLTRRKSDGSIERVCHYPRNTEDSNIPCYNCVDRAKCNRAIMERLAAYEDKYGALNDD